MTKKLLTQIKNEWLSNLWLVLELLVVSVVMWYVVDYLYTRAATYLEPRGFNIEHCYLIELGELTPKSPDYIAGHTSQQTHDDIAELLERLRRRPEIEAVSLSQNSYPYNGSNSGAEVSYDTLRSSLRIVQAGVDVAELKGKDWMPAHGLAMSIALNPDAFAHEEIGREQAISYLRKEAVVLSETAPRGIVLLTYKQIPLGFVKNIGNRANNLYPQEWRIRSGYLPETVVKVHS